MNKLKLFYFLSIIGVTVLLFFILYSVFHHMTPDLASGTVVNHGLLEFSGHSIVHFAIINNEGHAIYYTVLTSVDGSDLTNISHLFIENGQRFGYRRYIYPDGNGKKEVNVLIYREGESEPIENLTYYVSVRAS